MDGWIGRRSGYDRKWWKGHFVINSKTYSFLHLECFVFTGPKSPKQGETIASAKVRTSTWHIYFKGSDRPQTSRWVPANSTRCKQMLMNGLCLLGHEALRFSWCHLHLTKVESIMLCWRLENCQDFKMYKLQRMHLGAYD